MNKWMWLAAGSLAGGLARYVFSGAAHRLLGAGFPYGTMAVNLLGCFLIGFLDALAQERMALGAAGRMFLMVGFCGAFTTFSTFALETSALLREGDWARAAVNVGVAVAAGLILVRAGVATARAI